MGHGPRLGRMPGVAEDVVRPRTAEMNLIDVIAGLVPATPIMGHGRAFKRGGRDKPGHDRSVKTPKRNSTHLFALRPAISSAARR
jgi:hypothetical protein